MVWASVLLGGSMLGGCAADLPLPGFGGGDSVAGIEQPGNVIPYQVRLAGLDPQEEQLDAMLRDVSTAIRLQSRPTVSLAALARRADDDVARFQTVLRSRGFYDGRVTYEIRRASDGGHDDPAPGDGTDEADVADATGVTGAFRADLNANPHATDGGDGNRDDSGGAGSDVLAGASGKDAMVQNPPHAGDSQNRPGNASATEGEGDDDGKGNSTGETGGAAPVELIYHIDPSTPYLLASVTYRIIGPDGIDEREATDSEMERSKLHLGQRVVADPVILAEQYAVDLMRERGYPLAEAGKRKVIANTEQKTISVTYEIVTGEKARFGPIRVNGAETLEPDFIARYHSWRGGQDFTPDEIRTTRRDLAQSGLFDSVVVKPVGPVAANGEVPVEIDVVERKHSSIGGGVNYSTADGPGANAFWENRNLFGRGEKLRLGIEGSGQSQGIEGNFRKPQFLQRRQSLLADAAFHNYSTDAYDGELLDSFLGVERKFAEYWSATLGVTAEYSNLTGADAPDDQFYLAGIRGGLRRDSTDNPLDPTRGNRLELAVAPYVSLSGGDAQFTSVSLNGSQYYAFDDAGDYVLAGRGRVGSILGENRGDLPSNKRFYAGGGGSIRGYEYQKVGPLADDGDPLGGRSVIEAGLEFRARITESFGIVPFIEGGNVFESSNPENLDLLWATGLGFRYYTAVGPIRLDIAVPLDKRDNIDDDYQFYISLGQAF